MSHLPNSRPRPAAEILADLAESAVPTGDGLQHPTVPALPRRGTARGDAHARRILDGLPVPVLSLVVPDAPGARPQVAWINHAAEEVLGRSADDLQREPASLWGHVHADDVAALQAWMAAPTKAPVARTVRFVTREGRVRPYEFVAQPRADEGLRGAVAVDVVLHDVSSSNDLRRAVEERDQQLQALASSSREVVFHLRLQPRLTVAWTNDAAPNLLGVSAAELNLDANNLWRTVVPAHRDRVLEAMQTAVGGATHVTFDVDRHGEIVTIELTFRPVRNGGQTSLLAVGRRIERVADALADQPLVEVEPPHAAQDADADADIRTIDVGLLVRSAIRQVGLAGRTVEVHHENAPLRAHIPTLGPAVVGLLDNVRRHTSPDANVRIVVARAMSGVLISVADDGDGFPWPEGHPGRDKGIADLADPSLGGGRGFRDLAAAADAHNGRAAMQSLAGVGTTVRLLVHDAVGIPTTATESETTADAVVTLPEPRPQEREASRELAAVGTAPAPRPAPTEPPGHAPAFRVEDVEDLAPRFIEVEA